MCILRDLPQFYMFPRSHGFFFFLFYETGKKPGNKKRVVWLNSLTVLLWSETLTCTYPQLGSILQWELVTLRTVLLASSLSLSLSLSVSLCLPITRLDWSPFCFVEAIMNIYECCCCCCIWWSLSFNSLYFPLGFHFRVTVHVGFFFSFFLFFPSILWFLKCGEFF